MDAEFFTRTAMLGGLAVVVIEQILKLKFIPVSFANRYPVPTNLLLSLGAAIVAVGQNNQAHPVTWTSWAGLVVTIAVVAAIVYNQLLRNWPELKATEGEAE